MALCADNSPRVPSVPVFSQTKDWAHTTQALYFAAKDSRQFKAKMISLPQNRTLYILGFLTCCGLLSVALFMQFGLGYEPCPLCIFQRLAFVAIGLICLLAAIHNPEITGHKAYGSLVAIAGLTGLGISLRHSWLQHNPTDFVECGAGLDYWLETLPVSEIIQKVLTGSGECSDVVWKFLGLSIP